MNKILKWISKLRIIVYEYSKHGYPFYFIFVQISLNNIDIYFWISMKQNVWFKYQI